MNARADHEPQTISLGPFTMTISIEEFQKWFRTAEHNDRIPYARGPAEPRSTAVWQLAGEWGRAELVRLHRVRVSGGWEFIAYRTKRDGANDRDRAEAGRVRATITRAGEESAEAKLMSYLKRCANFAMRCPTNEEINAALNMRNAKYLMQKLKNAGLIRIEDMGFGMRRRVTIVETGMRTMGGPI
jgi:hypothetical protein